MSEKLFKIHIHRDLEIKAPFKICNDANKDWTHFSHLHRRTIAAHHLLHKSPGREIFLYKSRCLFPFPIYEYYIVFRDYPTPQSYRNIYVNAKSGRMHYLNVNMVSRGETTSAISDYLFSLPRYWWLFPKLFLWIFRKRMRTIVEEDNEWIREQMDPDNLVTNETCAPVVPEVFDPLEVLFTDEIFLKADVHLTYHDFESLEKKKRSYGKKEMIRA